MVAVAFIASKDGQVTALLGLAPPLSPPPSASDSR